MQLAVQDSARVMTRTEEFCYWTLGLGGAALALGIEWSWQGSLANALWGLLLMLILAVGMAFTGKYIGGYIYDEIVDPYDRNPRSAPKIFPAQEG